MIYPYVIFKAKVNNHTFWAAKSLCLRGCVGQGDTQKEALNQLKIAEQIWMKTAKEYNFPIPEIKVLNLEDIYDDFNILIDLKDLYDEFIISKGNR